MSEKKLIVPRKLSGFMELPPYKQVVLDNMIDKIKGVYQKAGFMPLDTPVLEYSEILMAKSGGSIDKEVYHFKKGDTDICMRYDLTVPLARHVAMNANEITFPFKRYQIGKVFRGEKAQKGRFREFIQCDADIVGLDELPLVADAECLALVSKVFEALGLKTLNHISNRNVLFGYCDALGYSLITQDVLTVLDKIGKIGKENAVEELVNLGVKQEDCYKLISLTLKNGNFGEVLADISSLCTSELYQKGISELKEVYSYLKAMGVDESSYILDIGIIRGQNYYTGTVFEAMVPDHPEFLTVCGGGRYDNLAGYYTDKKMPGVGLSIGLTRLFDLLDQSGMLPEFKLTNTTLQIIPMGETLLECLKLQAYFREEIACEVNYENRSFKSKMKEANRKQVPFILVVGENEVQSGLYSLKNMATGQQWQLNKEDCLAKIQESKNL